MLWGALSRDVTKSVVGRVRKRRAVLCSWRHACLFVIVKWTIPTTWEKKDRNTEAQMDGLCHPRHERHQKDERWSPWQNWLEENCVCRSDSITKWWQVQWYYRQTMNMENSTACASSRYQLVVESLQQPQFASSQFCHGLHLSSFWLIPLS